MVVGLALSAVKAGAGIAYGNSAASAGKSAAKKSFKQMKKYIQNAQGIISTGYKSARDVTTERSDKAQTYQDPYVEIGLEAKKYFQDLNAPGGMSSKYKEYLSVGDPLFDYANKKTSEALQRRLSALGRTDSGKAIEEDIDRSTAISYQFSDLADRRLQQEINLQQNLLQTGKSAADTSTQLQYNTGQALSNLFTREADINAAYEVQIGGAAANYEATKGNLEMARIGNEYGAVGGFISDVEGQLKAGADIAATVLSGGMIPPGTISKATQTGENGGGSVQKPALITPQLTSYSTGTGGSLDLGVTPTISGSYSTVMQPRTAQSLPPARTQNAYTYDPSQMFSF